MVVYKMCVRSVCVAVCPSNVLLNPDTNNSCVGVGIQWNLR